MTTYRPFSSVLMLCALLVVCGESTAQNSASSDADLSGLTLSAGTLDPAFARDSLAYTATVANSTTSLTVTPTSNHNGATITVNGTSVSSGSASSAISLSVGENTITIVVTAEDGKMTKTYTVTVERGVNIPDANLRAVIEGALKKSSGAIITPSEMATLTRLEAGYFLHLGDMTGIGDLTGLEHAIGLDTLYLQHNGISDISALSGLTNLRTLNLGGYSNRISDISALSGLTNLERLVVGSPNISDISALSGLTSLKELRLLHTNISDISALSGLTSLKELNLGSNTNLSDISALSGLTSLEWLWIWDCPSLDISTLSGLTITNLRRLDLFRNNLSDISALSGLTNLRRLYIVMKNRVSDISALAGLTRLTNLDLSYNNISDISALSGLTNLRRLDLSRNNISDISALSGLTNLEYLDLRINGSPLNYPSLSTHIPALQSRGVEVYYRTRTLTSLVKISGDDQTGTAGSRLSDPFIVEVRDQDDVAFAGVPVTFSVTAGGGSLSTTTDTTDANGHASTRLTLGATGADTVVAAIDVSNIDKSVVFTAGIPDLKLTLSKLTLSKLTLVPAFARYSLAYTATVANSTTSLTVTPTSNHNGATITVNGTSVSSGSASSAISLSVGENTITIVVAAEDGKTTKTYTVTVERGVNIPDANLRAAIEGALKKSSGAIITPSEMATLTRLEAGYFLHLGDMTGIGDLTGLEHAIGLDTLYLQHNGISDISALSGLNYLTELNLWNNNISDISALSGLTRLRDLHLGGNNISDISALSGLTSLERLELSGNNISDISALSGSGLTRLKELDLFKNDISDISPLKGLTSLEFLYLSINRISDISALSGLTSLKSLELNANPLSYPSHTTHIPAFQSRGVRVTYDARTLTSLVKISGDDQTGTAGSRLSDPFIVEVRDQNDIAFAGVPVTFSVTAGGGSLSTTTDTTDATGRASTRLTLGATGANTVKAIIDVADIDKSVTFTVTGTTSDRPPSPPPPAPPQTISFKGSTVTAQRYRTGTTISITLPQATGGEGTLTYSLTPALPSGLTFDATTRELSGTPGEIMDATEYTLTATDEDGVAAPLKFMLSVATDRLPSFSDSTRVAAQRHEQGTVIAPLTLPTATGGDEALTYALTPALPSGLTFDATTRVLSGTPQEALDATEYTLTATDADGDATTLTFTLAVIADRLPAFGDGTRVAAQRYIIGGNVRMTLPEATGGDGTPVYILLPTLPKGLRFDSATRTISGMPSKLLTETEYTLSAFDADGDFASLTFTLEVQQPTADFNGDGQVNFADFMSFVGKFGTRRGDAEYDARYDLDSDGEIGFSDFLIFTNQLDTGG